MQAIESALLDSKHLYVLFKALPPVCMKYTAWGESQVANIAQGKAECYICHIAQCKAECYICHETLTKSCIFYTSFLWYFILTKF